MEAINVYISQPMRGRSVEEIMAERDRATRVAEVYFPGCTILDNYFSDYDERTPMENLARSVALMAQADLVMLLPMYLGSGGCEIEDHIAQNMGIRRFTINYGFDLRGNYDVNNYELYTQSEASAFTTNAVPKELTAEEQEINMDKLRRGE